MRCAPLATKPNPSLAPEALITEAAPLVQDQPVQFINRYTGRLESEAIYGERWLRLTYQTPLGRLALHSLVKRAWFSRFYGWRMNRPSSRERIVPFIRQFNINPAEFAEPLESFRSFNDFFTRRLKPAMRPVCSDAGTAVFPADGRHLGFQNFSQSDGILVKGQTFSLIELLGDGGLAADYLAGSVVISRLCPVDYHRYHFPVGGRASQPTLITGSLQSVNPLALRTNIRILCSNRRWRTRVESPEFGRVCVLEVGATNVGSAVATFNADVLQRKGDEKGYFQFGGSLMITIFQPGKIELCADLVENSRRGFETYARMGDVMGRVPGTRTTNRVSDMDPTEGAA